MKKILKPISIILILVLSLTMLVGCGSKKSDNQQESTATDVTSGEVSEQSKEGGVVTIALSATPKTIDPVKYTGVYEGDIIVNVGNTLVRYKQDLSEVVANLATEWSVSEDGKVYNFKLRDDVYFQKGKYQDGRQMKADDIKYSLERSAKESAMNRLSMLDYVEVVNDFEVNCYLKDANSSFLTVLTDAGNVIVPQEEVEGWGDAFGFNLVGTGPFKVVEWKRDDSVILERNENYWGPKPYLDGVTFKFIADQNMMTNALRTGEIDIATGLTGESVKIVNDDPNLVLSEIPGLHVAYFYMNLIEGPTTDKRVREAIIRAIDIDQMVKGIYQYDEAQRAYLPLPPGSWGYDPDLESLIPSYDPEKAKELLTEAGYPDGFKTEIYVADQPARVKMATIIQQFLKQNLNIDLDIKTAEWGTFSDIASKGKAPIYGMSWTWYPDPYFFLNQMFHSSQIGALGNGQGFNKPEVDELLDEAARVSNQEERAELYKKALKSITEEYSRVNYSNEKVIYGLTSRVQGFEMRADNQKIFVSPEVNVWLRK
ncbi:ABC transporter substrate-binding protein [Natronincola ferrireducens]|uniref:Peptide/nickel transport system substrate-binding protein n=1 Tax=Natronincola ferrireducens TaxID=393762 RepID=A0A1G9E425_9FIRM|nr:ABC transporter substrate-binding protein [Natronincola ferrireducens]SDK70829.1 peptide/nickel transport system substrate-binding protein [Natronincola ferrireducens]